MKKTILPAILFGLFTVSSFAQTGEIKGSVKTLDGRPAELVTITINETNKGSLTSKNFGLGIGGNYARRYKVIDNSITGDFYLPSYTLINGSVFYNARRYRITMNVNNLNNEEY